MLGLDFPPSYRLFIEKYGAGDIFGIELYGIIKDPQTDRPLVPNGIWLTQHLRKEMNLPHSFLIVSTTGFGAYYVIDTIKKDKTQESPVVIWHPNGQTEEVAINFGEFVLRLLYDALK